MLDFSMHIFLMFCFLSYFYVLWGKKALKNVYLTDIFNIMKGKKNAKVHLIKTMKVPVKLFWDQGDSSNFKSAVPKSLYIQGASCFS